MRMEIDGTRVRQTLRNAPKTLHPFVVTGMRRIGLGLERHLNGSILSGQLLKVRTGNLRRATFHQVEEASTSVDVLLGVDSNRAPYGRIHEKGGTIRPTRSRFLTIPLPAARTGSGVARFTARQVIADPGAYGYTGTFVAKRVIFGKRGPDQIEPLFALKSHVRIRPVGFLTHTVDDKRAWMPTELRGAVHQWAQTIN